MNVAGRTFFTALSENPDKEAIESYLKSNYSKIITAHAGMEDGGDVRYPPINFYRIPLLPGDVVTLSTDGADKTLLPYVGEPLTSPFGEPPEGLLGPRLTSKLFSELLTRGELPKGHGSALDDNTTVLLVSCRGAS
jgi:hypothetical protein